MMSQQAQARRKTMTATSKYSRIALPEDKMGNHSLYICIRCGGVCSSRYFNQYHSPSGCKQTSQSQPPPPIPPAATAPTPATPPPTIPETPTTPPPSITTTPQTTTQIKMEEEEAEWMKEFNVFKRQFY